jgi:hypothetical protein
MNTLLLEQTNWDLCLDAQGNIAMAADPYACAQDVASAVKLFLGELWFDTRKGIPYWDQILGHAPPMSLIRAQIVSAALTVPRVASARCIIAAFSARKISWQVQVIDTAGQALNVQF